MNEQLVDIFVVKGDYGNAGGGALIGVFTDEEVATRAARGRGSMDCGGDGRVSPRKALEVDGSYYLLDEQSQAPITVNTILREREGDYIDYDVYLKSADSTKKIDIVRTLRTLTGFGLRDALSAVENVPHLIKKGVSKEEALRTKMAMEYAGAVIEIR